MTNDKFEDIDRLYYPDRTQGSERQNLFEFVQGAREFFDGFSGFGQSLETNIRAMVVFSRDLDLTIHRRVGASLYYLASFIGGLVIIFWIIGYILVSCLTMYAYEDYMVGTVYPTKTTLKNRVKRYTKQLSEKEKATFSDVLDDDLQV